MLHAFATIDPSRVLASMPTRSEPRFSQQYTRYRRFVGHALRRVGVAEADVDDLSQEVFLVLLRNIRDLGETDRLMGWLHQVARRVASNHRRGVLRRDRRRAAWSERTELDDPERALARAEAAGFLAGFLEGLDDEARPVFLLSEVEGMAGPAIARRLGLNVNTTYSRIRSLRRRFAAAVDEQRATSAAWVVALPSLVGPSGWGPVGWALGVLRTTATHKALVALTVVLVALALAMITRGSCSTDPEGGPAAAPIIGLEDPAERGPASPDDEAEAAAAAFGRRGAATIMGRVEDLRGAGVPDATVCVARGRAATPRCTTTDSDGGYSIAGELAGTVVLVASARGYVAAPAFDHRPFRRVRVPATGTLRGVDLLLRPGGREVSGLVRDVVGGPIEGATVVSLLDLDDIAVSRTQSDEEGRFSLWVDATEFVTLRASAEGYVPEDALASQPAGAAFELVLVPEAVIEGQVVDGETGTGLADVVVEAPRRHYFEPAYTTRTDASGRFRIAGLRPGRYKPRVRDRAWLGHAHEAVALELGATVGGVLIRAHGARQIAGRVQRPGGDPCIEGHVTLRDAAGEELVSERVDEGGEVRLGGLLPGEYTIGASCDPQFWAREVETAVDVLAADVEGAVWEVPEAYHGERAVRGRVRGPDGEPVAFAGVEVVRAEVLDDGTLVGPTTLTERDGRFAIEPLPTGLYRISIEAEGFARHAAEVELSDRDVDVELVLAAAAGLRIHTKDPRGAAVAGVDVKIVATDGASDWQSTNADGWADSTDLRAGTYELVVSRPGVGGRAGPEDPSHTAKGTHVTIAAGRTSEITLTVPTRDGSIRGRALRADGDPVADALVTVESSWTYVDFMGEPRSASVGEAHTDEEGRFLIEGLEAEAFTVTIRDAFGETASQTEVEPGTRVAFELPTPGRLTGTVEIEGEAPPEHFTVTLTPAKGPAHTEAFLRTDGRWSLVGVPPGVVRVEVSSAWGTAQAQATVEAGRDAGPLTLRLAPRGQLRGRVVRAADGEPLAGVHVVVLSDHGPATGAIGTTNGDGEFELATTPSGSVVVKVIAPVGYRPQRLAIEVPSGETVDLGEVGLEAIERD
jgi:RNA polymerase sigma factor (sigma-70 family)